MAQRVQFGDQAFAGVEEPSDRRTQLFPSATVQGIVLIGSDRGAVVLNFTDPLGGVVDVVTASNPWGTRDFIGGMTIRAVAVGTALTANAVTKQLAIGVVPLGTGLVLAAQSIVGFVDSPLGKRTSACPAEAWLPASKTANPSSQPCDRLIIKFQNQLKFRR